MAVKRLRSAVKEDDAMTLNAINPLSNSTTIRVFMTMQSIPGINNSTTPAVT
jgi:hypothetical protein